MILRKPWAFFSGNIIPDLEVFIVIGFKTLFLADVIGGGRALFVLKRVGGDEIPGAFFGGLGPLFRWKTPDGEHNVIKYILINETHPNLNN